MEVDAVTITPQHTKLTPALCEQLCKEGKCFYCRQKGHASYDCPELAKQKKPKARTAEVAATTTENSVKETPTTMDFKSMASTLRNLGEEDRVRLMAEMDF